ncbi:MAG: hypothetical protein JNN26_16855 [Candidatus Obscuribacter sp.]|nr:hypothetical protein [Candidatus Obscuribacter sp.]
MVSCSAEINRVEKSYAARKENEPDWQPSEISGDCLLHHFVSRSEWPDDSEKPLASAFSDSGMSVIVEGSVFGALTPTDIKRAILGTGLSDLEGAVSFLASDVTSLGYKVMHDPNDYYNSKTSTFEKQAPNHAEIICDKRSNKKRDTLRDLCRPSLTPEQFNSLDIEERTVSNPETEFSAAERGLRGKPLMLVLGLLLLVFVLWLALALILCTK